MTKSKISNGHWSFLDFKEAFSTFATLKSAQIFCSAPTEDSVRRRRRMLASNCETVLKTTEKEVEEKEDAGKQLSKQFSLIP